MNVISTNISQNNQYNCQKPAFGARVFPTKQADIVISDLGSGFRTLLEGYTDLFTRIDCEGKPVDVILGAKKSLRKGTQFTIQTQLKDAPNVVSKGYPVKIPKVLLGKYKYNQYADKVKALASDIESHIRWSADELKDSPEYLAINPNGVFIATTVEPDVPKNVIKFIPKQK